MTKTTKKTEAISKPIYIFCGENNYLSLQKLQFWKNEFAKKYGAEAVEEVESKEFDRAEFITNIQSIPFLTEKRLLVIKNYLNLKNKDDQKLIATNLTKSDENCIIVFYENGSVDKTSPIYKKILQIGKVDDFKALTQSETTKLIADISKKENIKLDTPTNFYLYETCGPDIWNIVNELNKLKHYANGKPISREMINELCTASLSSSIFKLIDHIGQKNIKKSLESMITLEESNEDLGKIFFMIARQFRIIIQVKELMDSKESQASIAKILKQHPFVIQKTMAQCKNFDYQKLKTTYGKLLEIDIKTKTGGIKTSSSDNRQYKLAIEHLIIDCCKK